ncbi:LOW QUALITY PROTEIN: ABCA10 isoform 10 [Pongo abelii]|uniref:ABCA10 isoform 10 n=1 Tax=Pongo abelii TaxID=9601 RepID=A0A2J8V0D1_PONAB|nr:LOW QUALITY PROTEIN: ABCA10 isoform 10 [Pongo abelii]
MNKMALASFMKGRTVLGTPDETMDIALPKKYHEMVGVIFSDTLSYRLTFNWGYRIPVIKEHSEYTGHNKSFCNGGVDISYWNKYEDTTFHF